MLNRFVEMAETGEVHYLIIGFSPVAQNRFKIVDISDEWDVVMQLGILTQCRLKLTLEEYT